MSFHYTISPEKDTYEVKLGGKLMSKPEATELIEELEQIVLDNDSISVLINLEEMEYMNSSGLAVLINILTKIRNNGGDAVIFNVSDKIKQLLVITKLSTVFSIAQSKEEALDELKKLQQ